MQINNEEDMICERCDTGRFVAFSLSAPSQSDISGRRHTMKLQKVEDKKRMSRRVEVTKQAEKYVAPLGLQRWKWHMKSLFYDFIMNGDPDKESATNIDVKFGHYYAMEITSLLELAIWKQSILRGFFDEMQEVHDYAALDGQFDKPQPSRCYDHKWCVNYYSSCV